MFSNVVSVISLIVSTATAVFAVTISRVISNREVASAVISEYYATMRSLTDVQLAEWRLAHLFETRENYPSVVQQLSAVAPPQDDVEHRTQILLNERAVALQLFASFEHVVYQLHHANQAKDNELAEFLKDAEEYFVNRLLINPRLLFLWSPEGGNLADEFEPDVRNKIDDAIAAEGIEWDEHGPYNR